MRADARCPATGRTPARSCRSRSADGAATAFNLTALQNAFKHKADGSGVFETGQHPIIVGQAAYNSAYGKRFVGSGDCTNPSGTNKCDGYARINQQGGDLSGSTRCSGPQVKVKIEPKAMHDEMNSSSFDEFGRMTDEPRPRGRPGDARSDERQPDALRLADDGDHRRHAACRPPT